MIDDTITLGFLREQQVLAEYHALAIAEAQAVGTHVPPDFDRHREDQTSRPVGLQGFWGLIFTPDYNFDLLR